MCLSQTYVRNLQNTYLFDWLTPCCYFGVIALFGSIVAGSAQRLTIPEAVAKGATGSVASAPSGPVPTVKELVHRSDVVVIGTIGEPHSYISEDQYEVFTDYPIRNPRYLYESKSRGGARPGTVPDISVTLRGGTVLVNGRKYTQKEDALALLQSGSMGLFLLRHVADKFTPAGVYYGAFAVSNGRVMPLVPRNDFAPEFRNITVSDAENRILALTAATK
jgi:hypothetical protein